MKYCLDTNAVIKICKTDENLSRFCKVVASSSDQFFIPSYVMDEFVDGLEKHHDQKLRGEKLTTLDCVEVGEEHFFTLDQSLLDGSDILASGSSGFSDIKYSMDDHKASGSKKEYAVWRRRKLNDHLIAEMSESRLCDGIVTGNLKHFTKIGGIDKIRLLSVDEFLQ